VLVVNTASECGFTPQFEGLEALWRRRRDEGLVVLGFPANDFAGQEPRSNREIGRFCRANFGVTFPMFAKLKVTGKDAHPLFQALGQPDWTSTSTSWIAAAGWLSAGGLTPSPTIRRSPESSMRC
jgi:glutathione peroxidase